MTHIDNSAGQSNGLSEDITDWINAAGGRVSSLRFLRAWTNKWNPAHFVNILSRPADGRGGMAYSFKVADLHAMDPGHYDAALRFMEGEQQKNLNLYFTVNPTTLPVGTTPRKDQIAGVAGYAIDIDPLDGELFRNSRAKLLDLADKLRNALSTHVCLLDSGHGIQLFYQRAEQQRKFPVAGHYETVEDGERNCRNLIDVFRRRLRGHLDVDSVFNANRIMRLPGSFNFASEKKLKAGYPPHSAPNRAEVLSFRPDPPLVPVANTLTAIGFPDTLAVNPIAAPSAVDDLDNMLSGVSHAKAPATDTADNLAAMRAALAQSSQINAPVAALPVFNPDLIIPGSDASVDAIMGYLMNPAVKAYLTRVGMQGATGNEPRLDEIAALIANSLPLSQRFMGDKSGLSDSTGSGFSFSVAALMTGEGVRDVLTLALGMMTCPYTNVFADRLDLSKPNAINDTSTWQGACRQMARAIVRGWRGSVSHLAGRDFGGAAPGAGAGGAVSQTAAVSDADSLLDGMSAPGMGHNNPPAAPVPALPQGVFKGPSGKTWSFDQAKAHIEDTSLPAAERFGYAVDFLEIAAQQDTLDDAAMWGGLVIKRVMHSGGLTWVYLGGDPTERPIVLDPARATSSFGRIRLNLGKRGGEMTLMDIISRSREAVIPEHMGLQLAPGEGLRTSRNRVNLWRGRHMDGRVQADAKAAWRVKPLLHMIWDRLCSRDPENFKYVIRWMAHLLQRPGLRMTAVLVLSGPKRIGKTLLLQIMAAAIGKPHAGMVSHSGDIVDKFNSQIMDWIFAGLDEVDLTSNNVHATKIRSMITSPTNRIEIKFQTPYYDTNALNLMMTTNNRHPADLEDGETRYAVIESRFQFKTADDDEAGRKAERDAYYGPIYRLLTEGTGREWSENTNDKLGKGFWDFIAYLLSVDLKGWKATDLPKSASMRQARARSASSGLGKAVEEWITEMLRGDVAPGWTGQGLIPASVAAKGATEWDGWGADEAIAVPAIRQSFVDWMVNNGKAGFGLGHGHGGGTNNHGKNGTMQFSDAFMRIAWPDMDAARMARRAPSRAAIGSGGNVVRGFVLPALDTVREMFKSRGVAVE